MSNNVSKRNNSKYEHRFIHIVQYWSVIFKKKKVNYENKHYQGSPNNGIQFTMIKKHSHYILKVYLM